MAKFKENTHNSQDKLKVLPKPETRFVENRSEKSLGYRDNVLEIEISYWVWPISVFRIIKVFEAID